MNWKELNEELSGCSIKHAETLFKEELKGERRKTFFERIVARIVAIKGEQEREMLEGRIEATNNAIKKAKSRN